jgi:predicted Zn-dependent peptidase
MIKYQYFCLENGLQVYLHEDHTNPQVVLNLLYNVGAKDEDPEKTGFAHLFEHLMFGGSKHINSFDEPLQNVGGENNAFTNNDITNYYITVPSYNIETAFWLESDRMLSLSFDPKVLEVQRSVVIEEFKQRYLNQPYGDAWLKIRQLAYKVHPYRWATIGKEISHIEKATMDDVKAFFFKHYIPNNAILVLAGNISLEKAQDLSKKWFGPIPKGNKEAKNIPVEPAQNHPRFAEIEANVPLSALYKVYHSPARDDKDYYASDLLSDILGRGKSSFLYQKLVKEKKIFNSINSYVTGASDAGLLVIEGKINQDMELDQANEEVEKIVEQLRASPVKADIVEKVKNQAETSIVFGNIELLNRAMNLAFAANIGNPELVNIEPSLIASVSSNDIWNVAKKVLDKNNCSTLYYKSVK